VLINPTRKQLNQQAIKEDKIEQAIIKDFKRDLIVLFKRILKDLKKQYIAIGLIPDQRIYEENFIAIIAEYQKETGKVFAGTSRDKEFKSISLYERKESDIGLTDDEESIIEEEVALALLLFIDANSISQAKFIIATNTRQMVESTDRVIEELRKGNELITNKIIVDKVVDNLKPKFEARAEEIAGLNVGSAAGEAKVAEAKALNGSNAEIDGEKLSGALSVKTWKDWGDNKVRPAHSLADSFYFSNPILVTSKFIVMGEALMYPRDPAGSPANISRCRCKALVFFVTLTDDRYAGILTGG